MVAGFVDLHGLYQELHDSRHVVGLPKFVMTSKLLRLLMCVSFVLDFFITVCFLCAWVVIQSKNIVYNFYNESGSSNLMYKKNIYRDPHYFQDDENHKEKK